LLLLAFPGLSRSAPGETEPCSVFRGRFSLSRARRCALELVALTDVELTYTSLDSLFKPVVDGSILASIEEPSFGRRQADVGDEWPR
jgi:hypothetical protein